MTRSTEALTLGVDIEEVYAKFGEGVMISEWGLNPEMYEATERKAQRVRDAMLDLGCPKRLVRRFEAATAKLHRSGDPFPDGLDQASFALMVLQTGHEISALMEKIRDALADDDADLYDVGVMLARLHLCLRLLTGPTADLTEELGRRDIYERELTRVVPIMEPMMAAVRADRVLFERLSTEVRNSLAALGDHLSVWDGGSTAWSESAIDLADAVFAAVGMIEVSRVTPVAIEGSDPAVDEGDTFIDDAWNKREHLYPLVAEGDYDTAEKGLRQLVEEVRRVAGPADPLTLIVRIDLAMAMVGQGHGDLAADRAYDAVDDAELELGDRHPETIRTQARALQVLLATKEYDEVAPFYQEKLEWFAESDARDLDPEVLPTWEYLLFLIGKDPDSVGKRRGTKFWKR